MLDGVKVWGVWRQEQQGSAGLRNELCRFGRFVKGGVVHDHEVMVRQARAQPRLQPGVEDHRIAGPFEQQRFFEPSIDSCGQQRGTGPSMPGDQAIDTLALRRISIPPCRRWCKSTFIDMDGLFAADRVRGSPSFFLWVTASCCSACQIQWRETWKYRARSACVLSGWTST